ncbi:hypothetical protein TCAL_02869 [Tigriopus californicus]|uniref:Uncharacterized protein n=1 Tax=Tigriopus californicus TaxID=6832 RepID=A0A553NYY7_TIGCA|nr:hypothetical protein TCAL_02869 [Tigriopus californicus]
MPLGGRRGSLVSSSAELGEDGAIGRDDSVSEHSDRIPELPPIRLWKQATSPANANNVITVEAAAAKKENGKTADQKDTDGFLTAKAKKEARRIKKEAREKTSREEEKVRVCHAYFRHIKCIDKDWDESKFAHPRTCDIVEHSVSGLARAKWLRWHLGKYTGNTKVGIIYSVKPKCKTTNKMTASKALPINEPEAGHSSGIAEQPQSNLGARHAAIGKNQPTLPTSLKTAEGDAGGNFKAASKMNEYCVLTIVDLQAKLADCPPPPPSSWWERSADFNLVPFGHSVSLIVEMGQVALGSLPNPNLTHFEYCLANPPKTFEQLVQSGLLIWDTVALYFVSSFTHMIYRYVEVSHPIYAVVFQIMIVSCLYNWARYGLELYFHWHGCYKIWLRWDEISGWPEKNQAEFTFVNKVIIHIQIAIFMAFPDLVNVLIYFQLRKSQQKNLIHPQSSCSSVVNISQDLTVAHFGGVYVGEPLPDLEQGQSLDHLQYQNTLRQEKDELDMAINALQTHLWACFGVIPVMFFSMLPEGFTRTILVSISLSVHRAYLPLLLATRNFGQLSKYCRIYFSDIFKRKPC